MRKLSFLLLALLAILLNSCEHSSGEEQNPTKLTVDTTAKVQETFVPRSDSIIAIIYTSKGNIICDLEFEKVPMTVGNFIGLSEGRIVNKAKKTGQPFFDGLTFHRVEPDFVIQGGDPMGNGQGGPGYAFPDEFDPSLKHNRVGTLSMANAGPGTNGSQFFITLKETPWLDGRHSVFGYVVGGLDVLTKITAGDKMDSVRIFRKGEKAMTFDGAKAFSDALEKITKRSQSVPEFEAWVKQNYPEAKKAPEGFYYMVTKEGSGAMPKPGQTVIVNYTGKFNDGTTFDSSIGKQAFSFPLGQGKVIKAWDLAFAMFPQGTKATILIPYTLAYGEQGYPGAIPPKATLIFDIELLGLQ